MKKSFRNLVIGICLIGIAAFSVGRLKSSTEQSEVLIDVAEATEVAEVLDPAADEQIEVEEPLEEIKYGSKTLNIKNIRWDMYREAPYNEVGWCGEATIQMAGLYYGMYFPQRYIHDAGNAEHPDLYASEISLAMKNIGMTYEKYEYDFSGDETVASSGDRYHGFDKYFDWFRSQLDQDNPIFVGIKRLPDKHPNWFADHFVLLVGYSDYSFAFNSNTGEGRIKWRYDQLSNNKHIGYSFVNHNGRRFSYAVTGMSYTADSYPVRFNLDEFLNEEEVALNGRVEGMEVGKNYTIMKFESLEKISQSELKAEDAELVIKFTAEEDVFEFTDTVEREKIYMYYCIEH